MRCANLYEAGKCCTMLHCYPGHFRILSLKRFILLTDLGSMVVEEFSAEDHLRTGGTITDHRR